MSKFQSFNKNLTKIALILIAAGAVLTAIGIAIGGSAILYLDSNGVHVRGSGKNDSMSLTSYSPDPFTSVELSSVSADIELIPSDKYGLDICLPKGSEPEWSVSGGKLLVRTETVNSSTWNISLINLGYIADSAAAYVKVYYPASAGLEKVSIHARSGNIHIPEARINELIAESSSGTIAINALAFQNASVQTTSGDIDMNATGNSALVSLTSSSGTIESILNGCKEISLYSTSGDITLVCEDNSAPVLKTETSSGDIDVTGAVWQDSQIKSISGDVNISGRLRGNSHIESSSGEVELSVSARPEEYSYDLSSSSGDISINGTSIEDSIPQWLFQDPAKDQLVIKTTAGDIDIDFDE